MGMFFCNCVLGGGESPSGTILVARSAKCDLASYQNGSLIFIKL